ncbi:undecaprenyl-diphosphatase UppP [Patescibacteria group bacterium]|nr:undecaprenyl-diphosphatase UppP [Patescibacteria group bacterium]
MTLVHSFILGIVEGLTEFLPISSTAHLEIASRVLGLASTDFLKSFEIIIQLGAILAVVVFYASTLTKNTELWKRIIVAFVPTGIIGFLLYKVIKNYLLGNPSLIVWTLGIGGIVILLFEYIYKDKHAERDSTQELQTLSYKKALLIGLAQSLAIVPGVSRSAATILSGTALGMSRKAIVEFSFLLAIPTMLAATAYDLIKNASSFSSGEFVMLTVGFITAFISALLAIKFFIHYIQKRGFALFGWYRIVLAIIIFLLI